MSTNDDKTPLDTIKELGLARERLPQHIAIIMDGNGRWARQRNLPRVRGHVKGAESVRAIVTHCARLQIDTLTLYSFSTENWKRPREEVDALMALYVENLVRERDELMANQIRLVQIGRREYLPEDVLRELEKTESMSAGNRGLRLVLAINYGGRDEIVDAVRELARKVRDGRLEPEAIEEGDISAALYTRGIPDPDLLIRTAGEMRVSNFLLWQISYSELYVTDVLWPDFRCEQLNEAIRVYAARERRFGAVNPPEPTSTGK